jgi:hypothetical protein
MATLADIKLLQWMRMDSWLGWRKGAYIFGGAEYVAHHLKSAF